MAEATIVQLLGAVMRDVTAVGKDGRNKDQGYAFRGIDGVINAVGPAFRAHGVVPVPELVSLERVEEHVGKNSTRVAHVTVQVAYTFHGPSGDALRVGPIPGEAFDSGDKAVSKAMSVAYRTCLLQLLAIPTHEPDPDESSYERAEPRVNPMQPLLDTVQSLVVTLSDPEPWQAWKDAHKGWHRTESGLIDARDALHAMLADAGMEPFEVAS